MSVGAATPLGVPSVFGTLLVVALIACVSPVAVGLVRRVRLPSVVVEVLLGAVVGPGGLALISPDEPTRVLAFLGLGFLLFFAGLELDPEATARNLGGVTVSYALSVAIAVPVAFAVSVVEPISHPLLVAFALASTSLGVVIAVLQDQDRSDPALDGLVVANASMGEFCALVLVAVLFSTTSGSIGLKVSTLVIFGATVVAGALVLRGTLRRTQVASPLDRFRRRTWQLDIRLAMLLLVGFAALAGSLGVDGILGSFAAGVLLRLTDRGILTSNPSFRTGIDAIGFGVLIPVFFISSGMDLDFRALFDHPAHLGLVPVFFAGILASRGLPPLLLWRELGTRTALAVGLLSATTLTVVVVAGDAALSLRILDAPAVTALVAAALLTQVVCPPLALALLDARAADPDGAGHGG